jgi:hypothetical protein
MIADLVEDPFFRQRYRFVRDGDALRVEIWTDPAGGVSAEHVHPRLEERYEVLESEVSFRVDGSVRRAGPGDRPVSTKLRCLVETSASRDSSSWLRLRRLRQKRINSPAVWGSCSVWTTTRLKLAGVRSGSITRRVKPAGFTREVMDAWPFLRDR